LIQEFIEKPFSHAEIVATVKGALPVQQAAAQ
jgi:FixJ family two-component response regulator